ncbi:acetyl-CoA carboxylase biotin carboxyl carrier protein [Hominifimenecus sp. rT4P-3]|uniref:acetyl-CoA carboxylase biotin carboxyl carrier protein n=1 Tax=Hominifimenecus sp. rT4P-3 TaxID=3242979 RepID=UPI003DA3A5D7
MEHEQILQLMEAMANSSLSELEYSEKETRLVLKKANPGMVPAAAIQESGPAERCLVPAAECGPTERFPSVVPDGMEAEHIVKSPLVGTFYSTPSEDAEPFVRVGDAVKKGQVLGIIETMKLMNEIECEADGIVTAILVENEQVVEYGQPLFRIR